MLARLLIVVAAFAAPGVAQVRSPSIVATADQEDEQPVVQQREQTPLNNNQAGRTAGSAVGQVGQRQTRDRAAAEAGIKPMARIFNRVQNRVQNRVRNRIDRNYDPRGGTADPFAIAEEQTRTGGRPR